MNRNFLIINRKDRNYTNQSGIGRKILPMAKMLRINRINERDRKNRGNDHWWIFVVACLTLLLKNKYF